ncbi:MAG: hypothetical protein HW406_1032 [Candidatus Brocadiaceae bacterium]|nr:hypothetical protein [Candidatus Brocadiaceae bacterium]
MAKFLKADIVVVRYFKPETQETSEVLVIFPEKKISEAEGFMIPHVSGLDVAGIERNNLPAELHPFYKEAFERCLLSTIHAGRCLYPSIPITPPYHTKQKMVNHSPTPYPRNLSGFQE